MMLPIKYRTIEQILEDAEKSFNSDPEFKYAYISGVLQSAYSQLCNIIEIYHNEPLQELKNQE